MDDIQSRKDIEKLVDAFYVGIKKDSLIGHYFTTVLVLDWDHHIPRIVDFWESILFGTGNYQGNPMQAHYAIHAKVPLQEKHFDAWISRWEETIDVFFSGTKAEEAKSRARSIAGIMLAKLRAQDDPLSIL